MGVSGLWDLLAPVGHRVSNEHVRNKVLAVDVSIWLTQFVKAMRDAEGATVRNAHLLGVLRRCLKLLFLAVKPVLIFDGETPALKRRTLALRNATRERHAAKLRRLAEKLLVNRLKRSALAHAVPNRAARTTAKVSTVAKRKSAPIEDRNSKGDVGATPVEDEFKSDANDDHLSPSNSKSETDGHHLSSTNTESVLVSGAGANTESSILDDLEKTIELDEKIDEQEPLILPEDLDVIDDDALVGLPSNMQSEVLKQIKNQHRARHREEMIQRQHDPTAFSQTQIEGFLRRTALNQRINRVRNAINVHTGAQNRIASDSARQYVFEERPQQTNIAESSSDSDEDCDDILNIARSTGLSSRQKQSTDILARIRAENEARGSSFPRLTRKEAHKTTMAHQNQTGVGWACKVLEGKGGLALENQHLVNPITDTDNLSDKSFSDVDSDAQQWEDGHTDKQSSLSEKPQSTKSLPLPMDEGSDSDDIEWEDGAAEDPISASGRSFRNKIVPPTSTVNDVLSTDSQTPLVLDNVGSLSGNPSGLDPKLSMNSSVMRPRHKFIDLEDEDDTDIQVEDEKKDQNTERPAPTRPMFRKLMDLDDNSYESSEQKLLASDEDKFQNSKRAAVNVQDSSAEQRSKVLEDYVGQNYDTADVLQSNVGPDEITVRGDVRETKPHSFEVKRHTASVGLTSAEKTEIMVAYPKIDILNVTDDSATRKTSGEDAKLSQAYDNSVPLPEDDSKEIKSLVALEKEADMQLAIARSLQQPNINLEQMSRSKQSSLLTSYGLLESAEKHESLSGDPELKDIVETHPANDRSCRSQGSEKTVKLAPPEEDVNVIPNTLQNSVITAAAVEDEISSATIEDVPKATVSKDTSLGTTVSEPAHALSSGAIEKLQKELEAEEQEIRRQKSSHQAGLETISDEMYAETRDLLKLLGIPYLQAPMEAEAQCAFLNMNKVVDGVITEDSDCFLFGAFTVYRQLFAAGKFAEAYESVDIMKKLGLARDKLIRLAYLLGSDYTTGVRGVGVVNSMEILEAFPGRDGLVEFRDWMKKVTILDEQPDEEILGGTSQEAVKQRFCWKHRNMKRNWEVRDGFPNSAVFEAYIKPEVDTNLEKFKWGRIDFVGLGKFCWDKFGWPREKYESYVGPLKKELGDRSGPQQRRIDEFFKPHRFAKIRSERLQKAVTGIVGNEANDLMAPMLPKIPKRKKNVVSYVPEIAEEEEDLLVKALDDAERSLSETPASDLGELLADKPMPDEPGYKPNRRRKRRRL